MLGAIKPATLAAVSLVQRSAAPLPATIPAAATGAADVDAQQVVAPASPVVTRKRKNVASAPVPDNRIYKSGAVHYFGSQVLKSNRAEATRLNATFCQVRGLPGRRIFNPTWAQHTAMTETHGYTEA